MEGFSWILLQDHIQVAKVRRRVVGVPVRQFPGDASRTSASARVFAHTILWFYTISPRNSGSPAESQRKELDFLTEVVRRQDIAR